MPRGWISPRWKSAAQRRWAIKDTIAAIKKMLKPIDLSGSISKALYADFANSANQQFIDYTKLHSFVHVGSMRNNINLSKTVSQPGTRYLDFVGGEGKSIQCRFCGTQVEAGPGSCPHCGGPK